MNEVVVRWPLAELPGKRGLEQAAEDLERGQFSEFYPIFGEIHSFTAVAERQGATTFDQTKTAQDDRGNDTHENR